MNKKITNNFMALAAKKILQGGPGPRMGGTCRGETDLQKLKKFDVYQGQMSQNFK